MARSEFSRLRNIVVKRTARLESVGFSGLNVPKASTLSAAEKAAWVRTMERWIKTPGSTLPGAHAAAQRKKEQAAARQRRYYERNREKILKRRTEQRIGAAASRAGLSQRDVSTIKRIFRDYDIKIKPQDMEAWKDYLRERVAQQIDKKKYEFDKWVEVFDDALQQAREDNATATAADVLADMMAWRENQDKLKQEMLTTKDYSKTEIDMLMGRKKPRKTKRVR